MTTRGKKSNRRKKRTEKNEMDRREDKVVHA